MKDREAKLHRITEGYNGFSHINEVNEADNDQEPLSDTPMGSNVIIRNGHPFRQENNTHIRQHNQINVNRPNNNYD